MKTTNAENDGKGQSTAAELDARTPWELPPFHTNLDDERREAIFRAVLRVLFFSCWLSFTAFVLGVYLGRVAGWW